MDKIFYNFRGIYYTAVVSFHKSTPFPGDIFPHKIHLLQPVAYTQMTPTLTHLNLIATRVSQATNLLIPH